MRGRKQTCQQHLPLLRPHEVHTLYSISSTETIFPSRGFVFTKTIFDGLKSKFHILNSSEVQFIDRNVLYQQIPLLSKILKSKQHKYVAEHIVELSDDGIKDKHKFMVMMTMMVFLMMKMTMVLVLVMVMFRAA